MKGVHISRAQTAKNIIFYHVTVCGCSLLSAVHDHALMKRPFWNKTEKQGKRGHTGDVICSKPFLVEAFIRFELYPKVTSSRRNCPGRLVVVVSTKFSLQWRICIASIPNLNVVTRASGGEKTAFHYESFKGQLHSVSFWNGYYPSTDRGAWVVVRVVRTRKKTRFPSDVEAIFFAFTWACWNQKKIITLSDAVDFLYHILIREGIWKFENKRNKKQNHFLNL